MDGIVSRVREGGKKGVKLIYYAVSEVLLCEFLATSSQLPSSAIGISGIIKRAPALNRVPARM